MQKFDIEDGLVPSKNGLISLSKKTLILVGVLISIVFVGSILATYFGKPSCEKSAVDLIPNKEFCVNLFCQDSSLIESNLLL